MTEKSYTPVRPEVIEALRKGERTHPHESRAIAAELTEARAATSADPDARRWRFFRENFHRITYETGFDMRTGETIVVAVTLMAGGGLLMSRDKINAKSIDDAIDRIIAELGVNKP